MINFNFGSFLETKALQQLPNGDGSLSVLDVHEDAILCSSSSLQSPPSLKLSTSVDNISWILVTESENVLEGSVAEVLEFNLTESEDSFSKYSLKGRSTSCMSCEAPSKCFQRKNSLLEYCFLEIFFFSIF